MPCRNYWWKEDVDRCAQIRRIYLFWLIILSSFWNSCEDLSSGAFLIHPFWKIQLASTSVILLLGMITIYLACGMYQGLHWSSLTCKMRDLGCILRGSIHHQELGELDLISSFASHANLDHHRFQSLNHCCLILHLLERIYFLRSDDSLHQNLD